MDTGLEKEQTLPDEVSEVSSVYNVTAADVEEAPHELSGHRLGRYKLLLPVAVGGMAQVWTARPDTGGLARTVAIKLVRPEYAADEEYSRMFVDEAMVASAVHHPNVCETYDLGRDGDLLFMALEWVPGDSLNGLLQGASELKPVPDVVAARIVADACSGLHAAHEALGSDGQPLGIVHRDISPPNILISLHGHIKVSDFGIAKARNQLHSRTRTGQIKGKFAYIPPEQILGKGVDRRADVYAMGCVLYVATLGARPFGAGVTALPKIVQGRYPLPSELRADYPKGLEAIVVRALSADPLARFQTADEMRLALEQWMVEVGSIAVASDVARIVEERLKPERRKLLHAIATSSRKLPANLAYELLQSQERTPTTPTASTELVRQPAMPSASEAQGDEATLIADTAKRQHGAVPAAADLPTLRPKRGRFVPGPDQAWAEAPNLAPGSRALGEPSSTLRESDVAKVRGKGFGVGVVVVLAVAALVSVLSYSLG